MAAKQQTKIWVIVPAAGSGQRMGSEIPKQYLKIENRCILEITLKALLGEQRLTAILVCTIADDKIWPTLGISKNLKISRCDGGSSRAHSVMNGLLSLSDKAADNDWVLVHDAARPCISPEQISNLIEQLEHDSVGGILAVPAKDTLKVASSGTNIIEMTFDRSNVWCAQTPQMFRFSVLKKSLAVAIENGLEITDEASAVEHAGYQVRLVKGDSNNLKITTQADLLLAQKLLSETSA